MTVILDPDVAERIEQEVRRAGKPAQAVVNEALRTRLGLEGKASAQGRHSVSSPMTSSSLPGSTSTR